MSLLTIVQNASDRLGIVRPSNVVGSADQQIRQLLGFAQQEGLELSKRYPWQCLIKEKTWTATATEEQEDILPADLDHFINGTFFNRTRHRFVEGPLDAVEWQRYKASTTTLIFDAFRVRGNSLFISPTPDTSYVYAFEYVSTYWVAASTDETTGVRASWTNDSDVSLLPEDIITLGVIWRFKQAKGLSYDEEFRTYEAQLMLREGRDTAHRTTNFGKSFDYRRVRRPSWPDGSWNLS